MLPPFPIDQVITRTVREEWGRLLSSLARSLGDIELAEDVLQDAAVKALAHWPKDGLPETPAAWLLTTARRTAIDRIRRQSRFRELTPQLSYEWSLNDTGDGIELLTDIPDKRLELIFACCHPALDEKTRVALTLHTLGGLPTESIAKSFLDKTPAMSQRLVRAKRKITAAGIPYEIPDASVLPERLDAVLSVIYLIYNHSYVTSGARGLVCEDLANEAIRLGRILLSLMPNEAEVRGLLALMLLHDSRRQARLSSEGYMVSLERQNRQRWNSAQIEEGQALVKSALTLGRVGPYQLQAAISALHSEATQWGDTDWAQIVALYALLRSMRPSPVVDVNHAVAVSYSHTAEDALALLDAIAAKSDLSQYQPYFAARADILFRMNRRDESYKNYELAIALSDNDAEVRFLKDQQTRVRSV